ncbi:MAG: AzlD domain-containing protein [Deferribacteraceae bacterium]|jgi:branched-subunit amino acid transport protein AzlD|nr:AzlD domain-containing protein [Deferribacteraceae bacterium]
MLSLSSAFLAAALCAAATFFTRIFPFIIFRGSRENPRFKFVQRYIPPMTMVILVIYSFKDAELGNLAIPAFSSLFTAGLHTILKNPLVSIFSGTAVYMTLIRFFG